MNPARICIIMDIDGTLANAEHRLHLLPQKGVVDSKDKVDEQWEAFFAEAEKDTLNTEIARLNNAMAMAGYKVVICTGRREEERKMTERWLAKHKIFYNALFMRQDGDRREDSVIKREMLREIKSSGYHPLFAVEDRARVVKMWREEGLRCLQVCEGNY
jgi:phosphoglycolate phosphatase-like HAD superfamily hydrolase